MPPQKRLHLAPEVDHDLLQQDQRNKHEQQTQDELEHDPSQSITSEDNDRYSVVNMSEIRKGVQCPICLGIMRKTRTVMDCMHRFCRDCIEKSMRLGNNECPACRRHCSSRRSLRDDPNFDALIAALYPDIDKYEEEEMALHATAMAQNSKLLQASYAKTLQRQTKALGKKRNARAIAEAFVSRTRTSNQRRRRRNFRNSELAASAAAGSNDNDEDTNYENDHGGRNGSSSSHVDEDMQITRIKRSCNRSSIGEAQFPPQHVDHANGAGHQENFPEVIREMIVNSSTTLAWGKNGHRSNTRASGKYNNINRSNRISRLVDHLRSLEEKEEKDIHLMLVSFDGKKVPNLQRPFLCCRPTLSIQHLRQYVAHYTSLQPDEVELYLVKECQANIIRGIDSMDPGKDKSDILAEQQTLAQLVTDHFSCGHLLMTYKRKMWNLNAIASG